MPKHKRKKTKLSGDTQSSLSSSADSVVSSRQRSKRIRNLNYDLRRVNALQKKIDQTGRSETLIEIKGLSTNPQVIITCSPAVFEFLKKELHSKLEAKNTVRSFKDNKDNTGLVVHSTTTATSEDNEKLYVINFFNTTSRIQVNGTKDVSIFLSHYEDILSGINQSDIDLGNNFIKSACQEKIDSMHDQQVDESCNQGASTSGLERIADIPSSANNLFTNNGADIEMESHHSNSTTSIGTMSKTTEPCNQLSSPAPSCVSEILSRLAILENKQRLMEDEIVQLKAENNKLRIQLSSGSNTDGVRSSYSNAAARNLPSQNLQGDRSKPDTSRYQNNQDHTVSKQDEKKGNDFRPNQCVVVSITKTSPTYTNFQQDEIRRTINKKFGATIIQKVTKYNFKTEKPKFIIQLQNETAAAEMVNKWQGDLFGGSTARSTIQPQDTSTTTMMKGIPLDANDNEVLDDINRKFPHTEIERLYKQGKKLRTVLVRFKTKELYQSALSLSNGFLLESQHITTCFEAIRDG